MSDEEKIEEKAEDEKVKEEAGSVADEIAAAFDAQETEESPVEAVEETAEDAAIETAEAVETAEEAHEPLHHWPEADKELFRRQPPEAQKWLLDNAKSIDEGYSEKFQEIAGIKKAIEPWVPYLEQLGTTAELAFGAMIAAEHTLRTGTPQQKRDAYIKLGNDYGIVLDQADEEDQIDPQMSAVKQELDALKNQIATQAETQEQSQLAAGNAQIDAFRQQKTEAGDPAHPFLDDVMTDMVALAKIEASEGRKPDLEVLYDRAVWSNTTARASMLKATKEADAQAAKAKAAQAEKAASSISGAPVGQAAVGTTTLNDDITAAYDEHAA